MFWMRTLGLGEVGIRRSHRVTGTETSSMDEREACRRAAPKGVTSSVGMAGSTGSDRDAGCAPRALVVDDVGDNRDILSRRLISSGFEVTEADGGVDALDKLDRQAFDIVLLDIMMPDLCGNEVLRALRRTFSDVELPVIMVTALSESADVVRSLELGANDYLIKPVDMAVALARINSHLARKRASDRERVFRQAREERAAREREVFDRRLRHMAHLAYHDPLTGLQNRAAFRSRLDEALSDFAMSGSEPSVIFVDLDGLKAINDRHGHAAGDSLLREVAARIQEVVEEASDVARLGGDEFAVLILEDGPEASLARAREIVEAIARPFEIDGRRFLVGASCGVATASACSSDADALVEAADHAMYRAKSGGGGRAVLHEPSLTGHRGLRASRGTDAG